MAQITGGTIEVPMSSAMKQVALKVVITHQGIARLRMRLGVRLLQLAALVMGCGIEVGIGTPDKA